MANPKLVDAQRDFTAGEVDATSKRADDDAFLKTGMRQLSNARILNTRALTNRPGRNVLQKFSNAGRVEDVVMKPGSKFRLAFTAGALTVYTPSGTQVFTTSVLGDGVTAIPWTANSVNQIVWDTIGLVVYICFPGIVPQVLTWDGVSTWALGTYAEDVSAGQKRTPFYRLSPKGVAVALSGNVGVVTASFSGGMNLVAGHVGTRMRYAESGQFLINAVGSPTSATVTIECGVVAGRNVTFKSDPTVQFAVGDIVEVTTTGFKGIVSSFGPGPSANFALMNATEPTTNDTYVGPHGSAIADPANVPFTISPPSITIWDDEVMNAFRGWPSSCFADQGRLGFCNFPPLPSAIAWSFFGVPTDLYPDAISPENAIFELAPGKGQVQHVVSGPESSEFVFMDNAVHYIPISPTNPLKPGSVSFQKISSDGAGAVQPRAVGNVILYVDQGLTQVQSIVATGAYYRPFESRNLTDVHSHLFNGIKAIALPTSVTQFPERYAYVLNGDGTLAVGKYALDERGNISGRVGWLPWNGFGSVQWVSALNDAVLFQTDYTSGGNTAHMLEQLDASLYLDASMPINAIPSTLTPPGGKGPLWWLPGVTVYIMDGTRPLGPYATDANGFIVPNFPGEDLTAVTLRAGFLWTATWEPFARAAQPGQDVSQRMRKRRIARLEAYVMSSSGFRFIKMNASGTVISDKRIATWNQDDDPNQPPPLREAAYGFKPLGRAHDPRAAIQKDTPGPLTVAEIAIRVTV